MSAPALTRPTAPPRPAEPHAGLPANAIGRHKSTLEIVTLYVFVVVPFLALAAVVPAVWGWGLSWLDVGLAVGFYFLTLLGVTVGYHRHFTHGSFKAKRPLRLALAAAGSMAIQGPVIQWVADHRRHHAFSDRAGDPHSPWRYGTDLRVAAQGHVPRPPGLAVRPPQDQRRALRARPAQGRAPCVVTSRLFVVWAFLSLALPAVIGGLVTGSWAGAWSAFFWAGLVRVALLHHVTWSINSVCHVVGNRPFVSPRPRHELLAAGDPQRRRVVAQPAPRRPDLRPPRRAARPDRHQRPRHLGVREARLGERREVARPGPAGRQAPRAGAARRRPDRSGTRASAARAVRGPRIARASHARARCRRGRTP